MQQAGDSSTTGGTSVGSHNSRCVGDNTTSY
jgi:hypothetical protein